MATVASLWIGNTLGPIEMASIRSFLGQGDDFILYTYGPVQNIPEGTQTRDAREIFPTETIIRHKKTGSPAIHADLFRYKLLAQTSYIWVDLDVIALKPFKFDSDWIFGLETEQEANNAVLKLPRNSQTLNDLLSLTTISRGTPPMLKGFRRFKYWAKSWGMGLTIDRWPWGATGPRALTYYLEKNGEIDKALPVNAFYSISLVDVKDFTIPGKITRDNLPADAWAVHLWGKEMREHIKNECNNVVPEGCFLHACLQD